MTGKGSETGASSGRPGDVRWCPWCLEQKLDVSVAARDKQVVEAGRCGGCGKLTVYVDGETVYPAGRAAEEMCANLPPDIRKEYLHAASIAHVSPAAACAVLAPALERMCDSLGAEGKTLAEKITFLRKKGRVPEAVAKAAAEAAAAPPSPQTPEEARERAFALLKFSNVFTHGPFRP